MEIKAIFLDFYGTLVHEDDEIIPIICEEIRAKADMECDVREIGTYWWQSFSGMCRSSYGGSFGRQYG